MPDLVRRDPRLYLVWGLATSWLVLLVWAALPCRSPLAGALQALAIVLFVVCHGSLSNGWKGIGVFFLISLVVSFLLEATSIATGFPFGFYVHNALGPKPLGVPLSVPLGYFFLGWLAWCVARVIIRDDPSVSSRVSQFATPLVAAFVLTGYDYAYDPIGSTVLGMWTYRTPSGYFGVPLSNFLGWLLTAWIFFQLFALIEGRFPSRIRLGPSFWALPCLIWGLGVLQYPIKFFEASASLVTVANRQFVISDIYEASVIAALLSMGFSATIAVLRLWNVYDAGERRVK
jgi:uncharacterized membrane protein